MFGVDDYLHQAADSKNWPEGIVYDPDKSGSLFRALEFMSTGITRSKQYSGNLGKKNGITLVSIPDTLIKSN